MISKKIIFNFYEGVDRVHFTNESPIEAKYNERGSGR